MANALNETPTREPRQVTAGDTVKWTRPDLVADYPPDDFGLAYAIVGPAGTALTVNATGQFEVSITAAATAAWPAGQFVWSAQMTKTATGELLTIDEGQFLVKQRLAGASASFDPRSHARRVLDAIEAVLEKRATQSHLNVALSDGRRIENVPFTDLIALRDRYRAEVRAEEAAARLRDGERAPKHLFIRMG